MARELPSFIYVACRYGSEKFCKAEVAALSGDLKFAYSRPGFITFKVTDRIDFSRLNRLSFSRHHGICLGKSNGSSSLTDQLQEAARQYIGTFDQNKIKHLHFWNRRLGESDGPLLEFLRSKNATTTSSFPLDSQRSASAQISSSDRASDSDSEVSVAQELSSYCNKNAISFNKVPSTDARVFSVIQVDPEQFWFATHTADSVSQRWIGGIPPISCPKQSISRAYYKTSEAMLWSRFPFRVGDQCLELGSAPGGSAQALLEKKLKVIGVDPAEMDSTLLNNPDFIHLRKRSAEVSKRLFASVKWLFADINVAPQFTLDAVEEIVSNQRVSCQGLILTLKFLQPKVAEKISDYLERVRSWGFNYVRVRQLAFNRDEICVAALKRKALLRIGS